MRRDVKFVNNLVEVAGRNIRPECLSHRLSAKCTIYFSCYIGLYIMCKHLIDLLLSQQVVLC